MSLYAMNCIVVNDAIFTTNNLKQIIFLLVSATDVDDDDCAKGGESNTEMNTHVLWLIFWHLFAFKILSQ